MRYENIVKFLTENLSEKLNFICPELCIQFSQFHRRKQEGWSRCRMTSFTHNQIVSGGKVNRYIKNFHIIFSFCFPQRDRRISRISIQNKKPLVLPVIAEEAFSNFGSHIMNVIFLSQDPLMSLFCNVVLHIYILWDFWVVLWEIYGRQA